MLQEIVISVFLRLKRSKPGRDQTTASSPVAAQTEVQGISSLTVPTAPSSHHVVCDILATHPWQLSNVKMTCSLPLQTCPEFAGQHSW